MSPHSIGEQGVDFFGCADYFLLSIYISIKYMYKIYVLPLSLHHYRFVNLSFFRLHYQMIVELL